MTSVAPPRNTSGVRLSSLPLSCKKGQGLRMEGSRGGDDFPLKEAIQPGVSSVPGL